MTASILMLALLAALLGAAAWSDLGRRLIPNRVVVAILVAAPGWWWAQGWSIEQCLLQFGLGVALLALFWALFAAGWMGGGDVKLIAALGLWIPFERMAEMLVWMAVIGGALSLVMLGLHRLRRAGNALEVPYGVAIVAATALVLANHILTIRAA